MEVTKPHKFIGFGAMEVTKPYKFIGFGAMEVTKPYKFIGFGAMEVTKPCKFIRFGAPAALRDKIKNIDIFTPPRSGPESAQNPDFLMIVTVWTLPRDPPGEGGARTKSKTSLNPAG